MSKQLKDMLTEALRSRYAGVNEACVVDLTGLNVEETQVVRRRLTSKNFRLMVVKNSLARRRFSNSSRSPFFPHHLIRRTIGMHRLNAT